MNLLYSNNVTRYIINLHIIPFLLNEEVCIMLKFKNVEINYDASYMNDSRRKGEGYLTIVLSIMVILIFATIIGTAIAIDNAWCIAVSIIGCLLECAVAFQAISKYIYNPFKLSLWDLIITLQDAYDVYVEMYDNKLLFRITYGVDGKPTYVDLDYFTGIVKVPKELNLNHNNSSSIKVIINYNASNVVVNVEELK